jgi:hypothetical protein
MRSARVVQQKPKHGDGDHARQDEIKIDEARDQIRNVAADAGCESGAPEEISAGADNREQRKQHIRGNVDRSRPPLRDQPQYRRQQKDQQRQRQQRFERLAHLPGRHARLLRESGRRARGDVGMNFDPFIRSR